MTAENYHKRNNTNMYIYDIDNKPNVIKKHSWYFTIIKKYIYLYKCNRQSKMSSKFLNDI